ncbi:MAG: TauD/TfdA family dioxygenase [Proteobacteria bacterium]|nr:TauD/TfdA family dioxygenase [Pseudomonadota bacterium]
MLKATPLTGTFGARISSVDLLQYDARLIDELKKCLVKYKVLVVDDQTHLTPDGLLRFAEEFGTAERAHHPNWEDVPGHVGVKNIHTPDYPTGPQVGDSWHTDGPPREHTQWFSFLHAIKVPPYGRDTLFADMTAAYRRLSEPVQSFLEGLTAMNSWGHSKPDAEPVEHPVILIDPDTGTKSLYVNRLYTSHIVGLKREESDLLLAYLYRQTSVPELQLRVCWKPGTLTMWDNEKTQHYIVRDQPFDRTMHRVMVCTGR